MSVCIAGLCQQNGVIHVALCSDSRIETSHAGADISFKINFVSSGWVSLNAGNTAQAFAFIDVIRLAFRRATGDMTHRQIVQSAAQNQLRRIRNEHTLCPLSLTYEDFLKNGKAQVPDDVYAQTWDELQHKTLDCELILADLTAKLPRLFVVDPDASVSERDAFAVIGSGATVAEAALCQRNYVSWTDVWDGLYFVYEAKRLSEVAPQVGRKTHMMLVEPMIKDNGEASGGMTYSFITKNGAAFFEKSYRRFGLQTVRLKNIPQDVLSSADSSSAYDGPPVMEAPKEVPENSTRDPQSLPPSPE